MVSNCMCVCWRVGAQSKGEKLWRMPLADEYRPNIKSEIADLKNVGGRVRPSAYLSLLNTS